MERPITIGLLGCGVVGGAFVGALRRQRPFFLRRHGISVDLGPVVARDLEKPRGVEFAPAQLGDDWRAVTDSEDLPIVVEVMGGVEDARAAVSRALNHGKHVVTANKALMAAHGAELLDLAHQNGAQIRFEAAVGGGVPIIGALGTGLAANRITSIRAILNGTTNFILSRIAIDGMSYKEALAIAQERGFAEPDPTLDVTGRDATQKLCILAALAFGLPLKEADVPTEGVTGVTREDVLAANRFGYRLKLIASARRVGDGIQASVAPSFLPKEHFLAGIEDEFNGFLVSGDHSGEILLVGRGAGAEPAASAVLSDVFETALRLGAPEASGLPNWEWGETTLLDPQEAASGFYLRLPVANRSGVFGAVTTILGRHAVNIDQAAARQTDGGDGGIIELLSQNARSVDATTALAELAEADLLRSEPRLIRIDEWRPEGGYLAYA